MSFSDYNSSDSFRFGAVPVRFIEKSVLFSENGFLAILSPPFCGLGFFKPPFIYYFLGG
ncbi:MAG: hypothetical protein RR806_06615 [Oscillospiraceae bacterium]